MTSKASTPKMHKARRRSQKAQKLPFSTNSVQKKKKPAHTLANNMPLLSLKKKNTGGNMLFDPTERDVNPFLIRSRIRTMTELFLALTIHDKDVTMAKPARVTVIAWTGLTFPFEERRSPKAHRNNELCFPTLSKQRFIIAVPSHMRRPSPIKVQVRCSRHIPFNTPGLH